MEFRILGPIEVVTDEGKIPLGGRSSVPSSRT